MPHRELQIGPPLPDEVARALDFAWGHIAQPQRAEQIAQTLTQWRAAPDPSALLLVARLGSEVVGGAWAQLQPGGTAIVSPPRAAEGEPPATADRLLAKILAALAGGGVQLAQALLTADHGADFERLSGQKFEHIADLLYMVAVAGTFPSELPAESLEFETFAESERDRLAAIVQRTYVATRDCPRMNGLRETADVVTGYRAAGQYDPARWFFLRHAGQDVGCLLLTEHPLNRQWELVYVGLVPEARRRGFGIAAVRHAQFLAGRERASCLLLAVDAANEPAIALYAAAGFAAWDRRSVLVRVLTETNS